MDRGVIITWKHIIPQFRISHILHKVTEIVFVSLYPSVPTNTRACMHSLLPPKSQIWLFSNATTLQSAEKHSCVSELVEWHFIIRDIASIEHLKRERFWRIRFCSWWFRECGEMVRTVPPGVTHLLYWVPNTVHLLIPACSWFPFLLSFHACSNLYLTFLIHFSLLFPSSFVLSHPSIHLLLTTHGNNQNKNSLTRSQSHSTATTPSKTPHHYGSIS